MLTQNNLDEVPGVLGQDARPLRALSSSSHHDALQPNLNYLPKSVNLDKNVEILTKKLFSSRDEASSKQPKSRNPVPGQTQKETDVALLRAKN